MIVSDLQVRSATDPAVVKRYQQAMASGEVFPLLVAAELEAILILVDGFHRIAAMKALGIDATEVKVHRVASLEEARWLAGKANLRHGKQLKPRERREVFRAYVHAGQHRFRGRKGGRLKSYREMSADLGGVPHSSLRNWTRRDFPSVFRAMSGGSDDAPPHGGLTGAQDLSATLERQATDALRQATASVNLIVDAGARYRLWAVAGELRDALEEQGIVKPPF